MRTVDDPNRARRLELVLSQLDSLPTLPAVAIRLLQVTADDESDAQQVIELVQSDQALTAKVLGLCRTADRTTRSPVTTVDKAVVLLGFDAIRNAVLSIKVFEAFEGERPGADDGRDRPMTEFSRDGFWRHALGVGIAAELICKEHSSDGSLNAADAFVCGLLHGIGKLAMEHLLPRAYERVVEVAEQMRCNLAQVERKIIGLDHHTVGKRLAEQWQLPHVIQDCVWLHGTRYKMLPDLPHRPMIGVIGVADLLCRQAHIGFSGDFNLDDSLDELADEAGLDPKRVRSVLNKVHTELERRAQLMGIGETPDRSAMLESIMQANTVLGRLNSHLADARTDAAGRSQTLKSITAFHKATTEPARSVHDVFACVVRSAIETLGDGYYGMLFQGASGQPWLLTQHNAEGRVVRSQYVDPPPSTPPVAKMRHDDPMAMPLTAIWPWISDYLLAAQDVRKVRLLPLPCGWGTAAVLLHDRETAPRGVELDALVHTWGGAVAAVAQHQGARRLGEQLVDANRQLAEMHDTMLRAESLARVGEVAAGAAHEMNNPLMVISGRAQLLAATLPSETKEQRAAEQIAAQADRLSDMITALRLYADPPRPIPADTTAADVLEAAVHLVHQRIPDAPAPVVDGIDRVPLLHTDADQLASAISELLINAFESDPSAPIGVAASVEGDSGRWEIQVIDDGVGMEPQVLTHAFDPFYSAKPAGRQAGLGLSKARRIAQVLGGDIELRSRPGEGTTAILRVPIRIVAAPPDNTDRSSTDDSPQLVSQGEPGAFPTSPISQRSD